MNKRVYETPTVEFSAETSDPVPCVECGRSFYLGYGPSREPMALHDNPHCAAFEALDSTDAAVRFSERCRAAQGDHRRSADIQGDLPS